MNLKPINDILIVQPKEREAKIGSIILAESAQEEATEGTVIAVGPGKLHESGYREPMAVKPGDIVLFSIFAKERITIGGKSLVMMRQGDVGAVINA